MSGSTLDQSSSSPKKLSAYPLSPSSPLPTPHAPSRKRSSSFGPISPTPTTDSTTPSPVQPQLTQMQNSPTSSTTTASQVYVEDPYLMETSDPTKSLQMSEFSPPIFAQSPVYLLDILNDPDLASILSDPLPSAQEISVTGILPSPTEADEFGNPFPNPNPTLLPRHPIQHVRPPLFYQNPEITVGYGSSNLTRPHFQPIPRPHLPPFSVSQLHPQPMVPSSQSTSLHRNTQLPNLSVQPLIQPHHSSLPSPLQPSFIELYPSNSPLIESSAGHFLYNSPPAYTSTPSQRFPLLHTPYLPQIQRPQISVQDPSYMVYAHPQRPTHLYPLPSQSIQPQSAQVQQAPYHPTFPPHPINYPQTTLPSPNTLTQQNHPHHQR